MQLHNWQIGGILSSIGIGVGGMIANVTAHLATFVDTFGSIGVVSSGILGAAGVMALGFKLYKKLDRIEVASDFTAGNFMEEKPGNLLFEIRDGINQSKKAADEAKTAADEAKEQARKANQEAAGAHALNKENSKILAAMRGHSSVQKENLEVIREQVQKTMPEILDKENEALAKLDRVLPTT